MRRTLIVTNDFPPRQGGIQSFVHGLATRLPAGAVVVYAPAWDGAAEFDAQQPFPVIRHPTSLMLPVPSVARRAAAIARANDCDTVLFGAAAPLGLITPALRRAGVRRAVALTLSAWTLFYGEHEKAKAERLAASTAASSAG